MIDFTQLVTAEKKAEQAAEQTHAQCAAVLAQFRADREQLLNRLTGIGLAAKVNGDESTVVAIVAARQGLLDLPSASEVVAAKTPDALKVALKARYTALLAGVPASVKSAFKGVGA